MEENLSRISQLTIKLCTFSICVSSIVFAQTPLVAFVSYQPWPLMVEWYIWKVGWFRVFGCSSSRALSAMPQLTILTLTSLSKTDNNCLQASKRQKYATEQINRFSAWIPSSILSFSSLHWPSCWDNVHGQYTYAMLAILQRPIIA